MPLLGLWCGYDNTLVRNTFAKVLFMAIYWSAIPLLGLWCGYDNILVSNTFVMVVLGSLCGYDNLLVSNTCVRVVVMTIYLSAIPLLGLWL